MGPINMGQSCNAAERHGPSLSGPPRQNCRCICNYKLGQCASEPLGKSLSLLNPHTVPTCKASALRCIEPGCSRRTWSRAATRLRRVPIRGRLESDMRGATLTVTCTTAWKTPVVSLVHWCSLPHLMWVDSKCWLCCCDSIQHAHKQPPAAAIYCFHSCMLLVANPAASPQWRPLSSLGPPRPERHPHCWRWHSSGCRSEHSGLRRWLGAQSDGLRLYCIEARHMERDGIKSSGYLKYILLYSSTHGIPTCRKRN